MLDTLPLLGAAALVGLLGGGHCLGMCGGLMSALTLALPGAARARRLWLLLAYNLGRVCSYALAGVVFGLVGSTVAGTPLSSALRGIAALLLIAMGLHLAGGWQGVTHLERLGAGIWRMLSPLARRLMPVSSIGQAWLLGALWGWLPCGLVYSTLLWAASQGTPGDSALLMAAFGLGTLPLLLLTGLAAQRAMGWLRQRRVRLLGGGLVILLGVWTFLAPHLHLLMPH